MVSYLNTYILGKTFLTLWASLGSNLSDKWHLWMGVFYWRISVKNSSWRTYLSNIKHNKKLISAVFQVGKKIIPEFTWVCGSCCRNSPTFFDSMWLWYRQYYQLIDFFTKVMLSGEMRPFSVEFPLLQIP